MANRRLPSLTALLGAACAALIGFAAATSADTGKIDFDRDIRPILSENCFACHGFDEKQRQAGLRLDVPEGVFQPLRSGKTPIVAGKPDASEVIRRLEVTNALRMPPAATGKTLKPAEVDLLKRWIAEGARFAPHWAFVPPKRPAVPAVRDRKALRNPIDAFIQARLEKEGLKPAPEADRPTLVRRLSLDLTGLPPTIAEVNAFVGDRRPDAYERLVDRLMASPHYGERMALPWLDLARYADTHGYHIDSGREMWPWRDWVIRAFNRNLPYDQFVVQQLAGDLLPNATLDQKIATGFNRNHPINFEGGAIPEEYHAAYIFDRIATTSTAFMGLTLQCAQCHDHKYDPVTQKDFYRLYALFNNVPEKGLDGQRGNAEPYVKVPTPEQQARMDELGKKIGSLEAAMRKRAGETADAQARWEERVRASLAGGGLMTAGLAAHFGADEAAGGEVRDAVGGAAGRLQGKPDRAPGKFGQALKLDGSTFVDLGDVFDFERTDAFSYGAWIQPAAGGAMTVLSRMNDAAGHRGWDLYLGDGKVFAHLAHRWPENAIVVSTKKPVETGKWSHVFVTYDGSSKAEGVRIYVNGQPAELNLTHNTLSGSIRTPTPAHIGRRNPGAPFRGLIDEVRVYRRALSAAEVRQLALLEGIRQVVTIAPEQRTAEQKESLSRYFLEHEDPPYRTLAAELDETRKQRTELDNSIPTCMVMQEMEKPRDTFVLVRGQYDRRGEKVTPGLPAVFTAEEPVPVPDRLAFARWLVEPDHPLTARVAVNRYWEHFFGRGLVPTPENFGILGERPSHPELLDWLATEFVRIGWDVRRMQKLIVTSAAYRRSSAASPEMLRRDPENVLLARGARFRLPAELVRDQALAVSGLLVPKIGGPSVKPYHPKGLWEELAFGGNFSEQTYVQDQGEKLYRRSLYTFWKRTCPPPSLQTFDAPEREFCVVRRLVTNTPLQALVLMNDPTYVEAARKLAERLMTEVAAAPRDRVRYAYRLALGRQPRNEEIRVMLGVYETQRAAFRQDGKAAEKLLSVGESPRNATLDTAELAAWTSVATVILNLDETITRN